MSNINKSVFILLTVTCHHYAFGQTECSHYYIPMVESKLYSFYFMEPANTSEINLDDISDIGVPRNCILLFNCVQIENEFCERPPVIKPNIGKSEFIESNATFTVIKTETLPTTIISTTLKQETLTTFLTTEGKEQLVTTSIPTTVKEEKLLTTSIPTSVEEEQLVTTLIPTNVEEEQLVTISIPTIEGKEHLVTTLIPTTVEEEQLVTISIPTIVGEEQLGTTSIPTTVEKVKLVTTSIPTTVEEEQLVTTSIPTSVEEHKLATTFATNVEQQPVNNTNELDDKYLIKISDNCKLNVSVFIKKNGCKINSDDDDNGTLIYDCENLLIDDCNDNLGKKDQVNINKVNETHCMNYTVTMKETASDKGFILKLSSETGRGSLSKNDKNACILTIVCNNDTHTKCKSIESNTIWKSSKLLYTASTPSLNNNSIEILKYLNGSEKRKSELLTLASNKTLNTEQESETSNISTLLEHEHLFFSSYNTSCNEGINCEKNTFEFTTNSDEGKIYTETEIISIGYDDITLPSTTVIGKISSETTTSSPEITNAMDTDTTFKTTLNDELTKNSEQEFIKNEKILPILMISCGSIAILTSIYFLIRKCIDLKKSNEYYIPETLEMGQGFTAR